MATAGEKLLHTALKERKFDAVYYFHGDDDFLKDAAVRDVIQQAADPSTRDFNLDVRRGNELDAESLDSLLSTPPMLADRRVAVIREVDKLKKDARRVLDAYLKRPASDTVLLLVSPLGAKLDRLLCDRATVVEFAPLPGPRVAKWVAHQAETKHQRAITPEAVSLLVDAVGEDLMTLSVELEKLASYSDGTIDESAVSSVVGVRKEESQGAFMDAIAARDTATALALLPGILQIPKMNAVLLVMSLTTQTLAMSYGAAALARGTARGSMYNEFASLMKETGAFPGRPWGEAFNAWTKHADRWSARDFDVALEALLTTDEALKNTRASSDEQLLASLILTMCAPRTLQRAS